MPNVGARLYRVFNGKQRARLYLLAEARADVSEMQLLKQTCPTQVFRVRDLDFVFEALRIAVARGRELLLPTGASEQTATCQRCRNNADPGYAVVGQEFMDPEDARRSREITAEIFRAISANAELQRIREREDQLRRSVSRRDE